METVWTPETSVYSNETTWCYIPAGSNLQESLHPLMASEEEYVSHLF
jgi:hypothetical protein